MKSLKARASRFFRDGPGQDDTTANEKKSHEADPDTGIHFRGLQKKTSRFFSRKDDSPPPPIPTIRSDPSPPDSPALTVFEEDVVQSTLSIPDVSALEMSFRPPFASCNHSDTSLHTTVVSSSTQSKLKLADFGTLKKKSSQIFRKSSHLNLRDDSPPPVPPLPKEIPTPKKLQPVTATPRRLVRARPSAATLRGQRLPISQPDATKPLPALPIPKQPTAAPSRKRSRPLPVRPPRPPSMDEESLAFMRDNGTRLCLSKSNRTSGSTAVTCSTPRSDISSSIPERLGLPPSYGARSTFCPESPLAARFPLEHWPFAPSKHNSAESSSTTRHAHASVPTPAPAQARTGDAAQPQRDERPLHGREGVVTEHHYTGPLEQYDKAKEGEWTLAKRVSSGPHGARIPGMLFRDRWGAFHFVPDI